MQLIILNGLLGMLAGLILHMSSINGEQTIMTVLIGMMTLFMFWWVGYVTGAERVKKSK